MEEELDGAGMGMVAVYPDDHLDPPTSHVCVGAALVVQLALLLTALMLRWRALARAADAETAFDPSAPLLQGSRYVSGTVELAEGETVAVRVAMRQVGTENKGKHGWSHRWDETDREVTARPFYLRRDDGARVRVEPGANVLLVDAVDQLTWTERTVRTRTAELTAGEHAICEGVLRRGDDPEARGAGGGYREARQGGWVMRPLPEEDLHVSTEPLADRHRIRARKVTQGAFAVLLMIAFSSAFGSTYLARVALGEATTATVLGLRYFTTRDSKGRTHSHYVADLAVERPSDAARIETSEELDSGDWSRLRQGERLHYLHVGAFPLASATGRGSSIHVLPLIVVAVLSLVAGGFVMGTHSSRRWYEGRLVDTGKGRLPSPPTHLADPSRPTG